MRLEGGSMRIYYQKVSDLLHYIIIFIYYTYNYVSYTYFTVYFEVFVCFEIMLLTSGVSFFVHGALFMR